MKKSWFDDIGNEEEIHRLSERLKLQVDNTIERELPAILRMGLKEAKTVLDLGTGNGYFLNQLAKKFPDKRFAGLEANEALVKTASEDATAFDLSNIAFHARRCPWTECKGKYDLILMRLALYCMSERMEVLKWARGLLAPKGYLCVADVDDGWIFVDPPDPRHDRLFEAVHQTMKKSGSDRLVGRKIPSLLHQAGFTNIRVEMHDAESSWAMGHNIFCDYTHDAARLINFMMGESFSAEDLANFEKFLEDFRKNPDATAFVPMIVASGQNG